MARWPGCLFYSCSDCGNPVALSDDLMSKSFLASSGPAFLFAHAMNVTVGYKENKELITGYFTVADIYCCNCGRVLGWKYVRAYEPRQMYKEGKYILELAKLKLTKGVLVAYSFLIITSLSKPYLFILSWYILFSYPFTLPVFSVFTSFLLQPFGIKPSAFLLVSSELFGAELICLMAELSGPRLYCCCKCRNNVSFHDDIISKSFQGRHGRAFLFSHAMNVVIGPREDRQLMTGLHTVADIHCGDCNEVLGWKYLRAYEASQKYKEGKFIFEKLKIVNEDL
ncbi:hypothetical protein Ancab_009033 [Ancistrocladus abbreviatus]